MWGGDRTEGGGGAGRQLFLSLSIGLFSGKTEVLTFTWAFCPLEFCGLGLAERDVLQHLCEERCLHLMLIDAITELCVPFLLSVWKV